MDVGKGWRGGRSGSRIVMVGDVRVMGALDVAPCHRLLVTIRVIGDDVKVYAIHVLSGGDGALIRLAMEGLQDFGTDG